MSRPKVVVVSPVVPFDRIPHAGGQYLEHLLRLLAPDVDLTLVAPGTRTNVAALESSRATTPDRKVLLVGGRPGRTVVERGLGWAALRGDALLRRVDPGMAYLPLLLGLARSREIQQVVADADVVDLQWSDSIRLAGRLRRLNPGARFVGTYHDVQSQLFSREPTPTRGQRAFYAWATRRARWTERRDVRRLDEVVVFSAKDAHLLGDPAPLRIVPPPLATGHEAEAGVRPGPPTALFVSYLARPENADAAQWLVREIWPRVRVRVPDARLRLVGRGADAPLAKVVSSDPSTELVGFVEDLAPEYRRAWACVVPLRQGAGVKFKTVEALLNGVPVVATTVGAEGIDAGPGVAGPLLAGIDDTADGIARALTAVLTDPAAQVARAAEARSWAAEAFSQRRFVAAVRASWRVSGDPS